MTNLALGWIYAFNVIVNSWLSFFTSILLVEFFAGLLRIKQPRAKVIYRLLPFFKIGFDLCLYHVSNWALFHGENPLLAEKGTRQLSFFIQPFTGIQFRMKDGKTFSIADCLALSLDPFWIKAAVCLAGLGSLICSAFYLKRLLHERKKVSGILERARTISMSPLNPPLLLEMKQITVALSQEIESPCIIGKTILFPELLFQDLSQEEIEAVMAHEMAHFSSKDCALRMAYSFIASLFWWIPTRWWQRRIEEMQEQAADAKVHRLGLSAACLASAILKTACKAKEDPTSLAFSFVGRKSLLKRRIEMILKEPLSQFLPWKILQYGLLFCALLSILLGKLWIF